jgi:hypothetical protein
LDELIHTEPGISDDASERPSSDLLVVGYDNATVRFITAENHVPVGLSTEHKAGALKGRANFAA